jgi:Zn-dependent protease with chaperone function
MEYADTLPAQPVADASILQPSAGFMKQASRVKKALLSFIVIYLLLSLSAIVIAFVMIMAGIALGIYVHITATIILGIGLVLSGLMLIYFFIKSVFIKLPPKPSFYELKEEDQPELFGFIRQLTDEMGAPFPKHIYLNNETNAFVFFDSYIRSMFLPTGKNLVIGAPLVNCINRSEFRAILAHEFGHFSQRSMRFGSYVDNFNRVIQNVLYKNKGYDQLLKAWSRWHALLRISAMLNVKIIKLIQAELKRMNTKINKAHFGLSREMEFHADAMSAYYCGANNQVSALRRLEVGENSYSITLNFLNKKLAEGIRSGNLFTQHLAVIRFFAESCRIETDKNGLPVIKNTDTAYLNNSRVSVQDPWSSHPKSTDREASLNATGIFVEPVNEPAWSLFKDAAALQEYFTDKLYTAVSGGTDELQVVDDEALAKLFKQESLAKSYNPAYKGFYDNRQLTRFDIDEAVTAAATTPATSFEALFTNGHCNLPRAIDGMHHEIGTLMNFSAYKGDDYLTFDFDGVKYDRLEASRIEELISNQLSAAREKIASLDREIFIYFYQVAEQKGLGKTLAGRYKEIFSNHDQMTPHFLNYDTLMKGMHPVYGRMTVDKIYDTVNKLYATEKTIKPYIKEALNDPELATHITGEQRQAIEQYISGSLVYYTQPDYNNDAIKIFNDGLHAYASIFSNKDFQYKRSVFDYQLSLLG